MIFSKLNGDFVVCKVASIQGVDFTEPFTFLAVTDDEISLVCLADKVPTDITDLEAGWNGIKINGPLDFSMVGVIAKISTLLAEHQISIFVISTFNTDYIFVKATTYQQVLSLLEAEGHLIN